MGSTALGLPNCLCMLGGPDVYLGLGRNRDGSQVQQGGAIQREFDMAKVMYGSQVWRKIEGGNTSGFRQQSMLRHDAGFNHAQVEVEMPEYNRLPGGDGAGPPDYFKGESSKWEAISDLDNFFERVYRYYCDKGFWCIVTQWVVELLTLGFTIVFSGFLLLFVNWEGLLHAECGVASLDKTGHDCNLYQEALYKHPLTPFTFSTGIVLGYLTVFSSYWLFCFLRFFTQLRETLEIRDFCHNSLGISDHELQTMTWPMLVDKMVEMQHHQRLCIVKELSAHDIVSRVMRKDNYMIGLLNKGVLALEIPSWLPGAGPVVREGDDGRQKRLMLTKTLEWSLNWCILQNMFDRNFLIRRDFSSNPARLRKRLMAVGLCMLMLSPFLIIFMLMYFFLRNAEQFYHQPSAAGSRRWSNLSQWTFREFNELDHMFKRRLNSSYKHAVEYVKQFPSPLVSMVAKFVSFVTGAFAAVLIGVALIDETLLEGQVFNRNLIWYTAIFAAILSVSRSLIADEFQVFDPEGVMRHVTHYTHYMPKHWRGAENTDRVRAEFEALFQYKFILFFEEMASIFVTPFILWFYLPECVDEVLQFVTDFTVYVEGVGHVCSLSVFDFEHHGNSKYGSPFHTSKDRRSGQGKMEKSFISFKSNYPNWEPDGNGKLLLSALADFRTRKEDMALYTLAHGNSSLPKSRSISRMGDSNYQYGLDNSGRERFGHRMPLSRSHPVDEIQDVAPVKDSEVIPSIHQSDQMYWLDRFYTASQTAEASATSAVSGDDKEKEETEQDRSGGQIGSSSRGSELDRSLSRGGIVQQVAGEGGGSRWWDRKGPKSTMMPESSFDPPMFGGVGMIESRDDFYESEEDHDKDWINRRHSIAASVSEHISEDESSNLVLPFGDVYERPRDISLEGMRPIVPESRD